MLDNTIKWSIIIFTDIEAHSRDNDAGERSQTRSLAGTRDVKPATPRRDRPAVCHRQLLRSQRSRPGQIRDAAPRAERGPISDGRRDGLRLLAALVLSGAVCLRRGRPRQPGSPQARSQAGPQNDRRDPDLYCRDAPERSVRADTGAGALNPRAFRNEGSSTKYRTQLTAASKKTPLNESGAQPRSTPDLTEQYEQLRREATSRSDQGSDGLGLALFLRRGMTAWMQAWAQCTDHGAPTAHSQSATAAAVPIDLRAQVTTLLAGIILGLQQEATL